jgi:hypothetical protein
MADFVDVTAAAQELGVEPSRVRALIAGGALRADKVGGRWLVYRDSIAARRRQPPAPGRPMTPRNAWTLLLDASGEEVRQPVDANTRWRIAQTLMRHQLPALRDRLQARARVHHLWALPGELRPLHRDDAVVLTGSSAAGALDLELLAPDTLDAYVQAGHFDRLVSEHGLEGVPAARANVILRVVPDDSWVLDGRRIAPRAAVGLDLASYPDSRSERVGTELLASLDAQRRDS